MSTESKTISYADFQRRYREKQAAMMKSPPRNSDRKPWQDRMQYWAPSEVPTWVRFVGEPVNFMRVFYPKKPVTCNCRRGELQVPCVVCYKLVLEHERNPDKNLPIPSESIVQSVFISEEFHKVEKESRKGTKFHVLERCAGKNRFGASVCDHCDNDIPKEYGDKKHLTVSAFGWRKLEAQIEDQASICSNCNDGMVELTGVACPECTDVVLSLEVGSSEADLELAMVEGINCAGCGYTGEAQALVDCVRVNKAGAFVPGCDNPLPTDVTQSEFLIGVKEDGRGNKTIEILGARPISSVKKDIASWKLEPFNLTDLFVTMDLDEQASTMGIENPFSASEQKILDDFRAASRQEVVSANTIEY